MAFEERKQAFSGIMKRGVMEERTHRPADHLGVPDVDGAGQSNGRVEGKCGGGAEDRADVAWILKTVEQQHPESVSRHEVFETASRNLCDRQNSLGRLGLSCGTELRFAHRGGRNSVFCQELEELSATRGTGELGSGQHPDSSERRRKQLLHRADALSDEKGLALPGFPAPKVAG